MTGLETGEKLQKALKTEGEQVTLAKKSRYLPDSVSISTSQWAGEQFQAGKDGVIFIGACGIAVRSIAPYIAGKKTDPAVLVIDECGQFVISLLSGHLGGANELAVRCAGYLHATPVVTTATDLHSRFAVDVFAKKNGCAIFHMKAAKEASAALLARSVFTVNFHGKAICRTGWYSVGKTESHQRQGQGRGMRQPGKCRKQVSRSLCTEAVCHLPTPYM